MSKEICEKIADKWREFLSKEFVDKLNDIDGDEILNLISFMKMDLNYLIRKLGKSNLTEQLVEATNKSPNELVAEILRDFQPTEKH